MTAKTGVGDDLTAAGVISDAIAMRENSARENEGGAAGNEIVFANHLISLRFLKIRPFPEALGGRYGSDIGAPMPVPLAATGNLFSAVAGEGYAIKLTRGWAGGRTDVLCVDAARVKRASRRRI